MTTGWAKLQQPNGMITESLSGGCMGRTGTLDGGGGRVMGDVSTIFVIESLQLYEWTNDPVFLEKLSPTILKAANWYMNIGTGGTPLPKRQCCTYDIIDFAGYDHTSFNSWIYLAALRAGEKLGLHFAALGINAGNFSDECAAKAKVALPYMQQMLWNTTHKYFRAWQDSKLGSPPWVMADTLCAQLHLLATVRFTYITVVV